MNVYYALSQNHVELMLQRLRDRDSKSLSLPRIRLLNNLISQMERSDDQGKDGRGMALPVPGLALSVHLLQHDPGADRGQARSVK